MTGSSFLTKCLEENVIPKIILLELEPTIGNHNQEFLDNWYGKLKTFSISMMEDIVTFCDKTLKSTKQEIANCENNLKSSMKKEEFNEIEKNEIEEATKIVLDDASLRNSIIQSKIHKRGQ